MRPDVARMGAIASRAEGLLDTAVIATTPVAGGDICTATRLRLSDGRSALVKTRPNAPEDFFPSEARGLRWLAEADGGGLDGAASGGAASDGAAGSGGAASGGGVHIPEVLAVETDCLILSWVEPGRPSTEAAADFGRRLAATHAAGAKAFGAPEDGYIGTLPMPNREADTWPEFYATRRILPYLKLARDRGAVTPAEANDIEAVVRKITDLAGPPEPPARLHGDLWSGNVLWDSEGRTWLVDPAAYAGHRETDLAMLALFGLPQLQRVIDAYHEVAPLADGWEDRVKLHQLFPLLVHACLFGGGYGTRAAGAAQSLL